MKRNLRKRLLALGGGIILTSGLVAPLARAQAYAVLHNFKGGADGSYPEAPLILDSQGSFYGTTYKGGTSGLGVVFKVAATGGEEAVLYNFSGGSDGAWPYAGLLSDSAGNLYGTTAYGGANGDSCSQPVGIPAGCGVVFKIDGTGKETVLHRFTGADGANPQVGLIMDSAGNLYGTAPYGGSGAPGVCNLEYYGCGVAYKVDPTGEETVLYSFNGGADGGEPAAALIRDSDGSLYGTAMSGGVFGNGVVFKLDTAGTETVLYSLTGGADGGIPIGGVVRDSAGNLYGTTYGGGIGTCPYFGCGVVFELDTAGKETVLYSFTGGGDGGMPRSNLIRPSAGVLVGTASSGGAGGNASGGVVFKLAMNGNEATLHKFVWENGVYPSAVIQDSAGSLYGTAIEGGAAFQGVVFKLAP